MKLIVRIIIHTATLHESLELLLTEPLTFW